MPESAGTWESQGTQTRTICIFHVFHKNKAGGKPIGDIERSLRGDVEAGMLPACGLNACPGSLQINSGKCQQKVPNEHFVFWVSAGTLKFEQDKKELAQAS